MPRRFFDPALAGVVGPLCFVASWVTAGLLRDGYDVSDDAISRLAEQGAPYRWIVLLGIGIVSIASIILGATIARRWRSALAGVVTIVAGVSALALGLFPCSPGCPGIDGDFTDKMHSSAAVAHYISFGISPLVAAVASHHLVNRTYTFFSVFAGLFGGAFLVSQFTGWGPNGITQRIGLTTLDLWMIATAIALRSARGRTPRGVAP